MIRINRETPARRVSRRLRVESRCSTLRLVSWTAAGAFPSGAGGARPLQTRPGCQSRHFTGGTPNVRSQREHPLEPRARARRSRNQPGAGSATRRPGQHRVRLPRGVRPRRRPRDRPRRADLEARRRRAGVPGLVLEDLGRRVRSEVQRRGDGEPACPPGKVRAAWLGSPCMGTSLDDLHAAAKHDQILGGHEGDQDLGRVVPGGQDRIGEL